MLAAVLIAALVTVALLIGALGSAVVARHRAQTAADLGALAAAAALTGGGPAACARAAAVVDANGAAVAECTVDGLDVVLRVRASVGLAVGNLTTASASARAGPAGRTGSGRAG